MNTLLDCIPCVLRQGLEAARFYTSDERLHEQLLREVLRMAADLDLSRSPPSIGQAIHRRLRELTGVADPYLPAKRRAHRLASEALPDLRSAVERSADPLRAAATFAVAANAIDLGVGQAVGDEEIRAALRAASGEALSGDWERFRAAAARASSILYLADNAGELAVDRLLIERLGPERVTLAVRGAPVLNDVTTADAQEAGLAALVPVVDNGSDAPGTILEDCSAPFRRRFAQVGLVVAKGQGNFETLSGAPREVFFLFKVKCPVVARHAALPLGTFALLHHRGAPP